MIKYLEKENLEDVIKKGVYVVDFYADWCGPCKMMGSILEKMDDVSIVKINTDEHEDLAQKYGIMSIPTLIFFKDGIEQRKEIGLKTEAEIRSILQEIS